MRFRGFIRSGLSFLGRYQLRWVIAIAVSWTLADLTWIRFFEFAYSFSNEVQMGHNTLQAILLRGLIVFVMSSLMGYILIFKLRKAFRDNPLFVSILEKTCILLITSLFMNFLLHVTYSIFIIHLTLRQALDRFFDYAISFIWLLHHSIGWVILFLLTQLAIDFYEKYSPGVFWDIMAGRYIRPKSQERIVMFLDLKDSTPIAEKLGSEAYFAFIRDFIYYVSMSLLEYHGRIYQYVGDEIVVSWKYSVRNRQNCIAALTLAGRLLRRNSKYFRRRYGITPEFRAGIHTGVVTVGEIGIIKKDLAMSGDIMNTAARIRTICSELNRDYITSKQFIDGIGMDLQTESLGIVDLKGKSESMELFALKI